MCVVNTNFFPRQNSFISSDIFNKIFSNVLQTKPFNTLLPLFIYFIFIFNILEKEEKLKVLPILHTYLHIFIYIYIYTFTN